MYTDEYNIYNRLEQWGYEHQSVCHATGEYARDDDGDGFCEVHVNTQEKESGRFYVPGSDLIVESARRTCPFTWGSLNMFSICAEEEKPF